MTLMDVLRETGADAEKTLARFGGNAALLERFVKKFPADKTYADLAAAVAAGRLENIEALAHTIKGTSANLGFDRLSAACARLVDRMRGKTDGDIPLLMREITQEYDRVSAAIERLD